MRFHDLPMTSVTACDDFAAQFAHRHYRYRGGEIDSGGYQFNQRDIKVYERAAFVKFMERLALVNWGELPAQRLKKWISK